MLSSPSHPAESVELTQLSGADTVYVRGRSPEVEVDDTRVRLLSGEVVSVSERTFDGFSSVAVLGDDSDLSCRVGRWVFPVEACRSLLLKKELLADAISGDPRYRDE